MFSTNHLALRLLHLKDGEEWKNLGNDLCILCPTGGSGEYLAGSAAHPVRPGDVLVVNGAPDGRLLSGRGRLMFWWFSISVEHVYPLFDSTEIALLQDVMEGLKKTRLYSASMPVARECHGLLEEMPPQFRLDHRSQLLRVFVAILSAEFDNVRARRTGVISRNDHVTKVFESLSTDEILNLSVPDLARKFGCSRRHLNRLFHHYFALSVAELKREMRMLKAVSLLRNPTAKVSNVAEQCGFNHLGLFNSCFKRRFGVTPGKWRTQTRTQGLEGNCPTTQPLAEDVNCRLRTTGLCPWAKADGTPAKKE